MFAPVVLLLTSLALPPILFLLFRPGTRLSRVFSSVLAVAAGWVFNVACVVAVEAIQPGVLGEGPDNVTIATSFGWACPLAMVLVTWLIWHWMSDRERQPNIGA